MSMDAAYYEELAGWLYGLALEEIAGTLAQDAIAIIGQERGDMLALAARMSLEGDLVPRALAACPKTGGRERRSL
jgi:hypothetical protein